MAALFQKGESCKFGNFEEDNGETMSRGIEWTPIKSEKKNRVRYKNLAGIRTMRVRLSQRI